MDYDSLYKNTPNLFGNKPNKLLIKVAKEILPGKNFLDLGCGQGRDSFYMARKKFNVLAVDNSKVAISQMKKLIQEEKIDNIQTVCEDIAEFAIEPKKFSVINCRAVLHFLSKKDALEVIENIKKNILPGGFIIISAFTDKKSASKIRKSHFEKDELKKLFENPDFKIHCYLNSVFLDKGHIGHPEPHKHEVAELIAEKKQSVL